ncbi:hypothetical protein LCGC14_1390760 [marine sediment metagenome]|uniref:Uncharacterized protein n=1 Tax=marine sediment metagenome TaxID=412755 RepID=A0A0F9KKV5_9ZZZZ
MAVSVVVVQAGVTKHIADVIATADADVAATVPHGLGAVPADVQIMPGGQTAGAGASAQLSLWAITLIDAINVVLVATAGVGSGDAAAQVRITAALPHTLTQ